MLQESLFTSKVKVITPLEYSYNTIPLTYCMLKGFPGNPVTTFCCSSAHTVSISSCEGAEELTADLPQPMNITIAINNIVFIRTV